MAPRNPISDSDSDDGSGETACDQHTKRVRTESANAVDPMKPTFMYLFRDRLYDGAFRYAGRTRRTLEERAQEHVDGVSGAALMQHEVKKRAGGKNAITLDDYVLDPRLPGGVPHHRRKAFEVVVIDVHNTVYSDLRNPLGLNANIGDNVGEINVRAVREEYLRGYRWPASSTALCVAPELAAARQRVEIFEDVYEDIGHLDPSLRGQLAEARAARDKLERLEAAANPFERARMHKQDYAGMNPGAGVSRNDVSMQLHAIAKMEPGNEPMQSENRVIWQRMAHPDNPRIQEQVVNPNNPRLNGKPMRANEARIIFEYAENWCAQQIEDALHKEKYVEDYDVHGQLGCAGGNHYMNALALRNFLDEHDRMPNHTATEKKVAGSGAVAEQRLGNKMKSWKKRGRKEQDTYDVVLRHHDVFFNWKADVKMQAHNQSEILLKLFLGGYGIQKHNEDDIDLDAKPMPSSCRACGKSDANYQAVKNYLNGQNNAITIALDKWEQKKPEDAGKIATYRAVHAKNHPERLEKTKASDAEKRSRGKMFREAVASAE